VSQIKLTFT